MHCFISFSLFWQFTTQGCIDQIFSSFYYEECETIICNYYHFLLCLLIWSLCFVLTGVFLVLAFTTSNHCLQTDQMKWNKDTALMSTQNFGADHYARNRANLFLTASLTIKCPEMWVLQVMFSLSTSDITMTYIEEQTSCTIHLLTEFTAFWCLQACWYNLAVLAIFMFHISLW